jgi:hypothetical protein
VKLLLENHAALHPVNRAGEFPINLAADYKHLNIVINLSSRCQQIKTKTFKQGWSHGRMTREEAHSVLIEKRKELQR